MFLLFCAGVLLYIAYQAHRYIFTTETINPYDKYVLISGCDRGVGHELAIDFDKQGFNVCAGVYFSSSISSLQAKLSSKATVFQFDITKEEDIEAAFRVVKQKTSVLHALINNAGIITHGYIDWTSLDVMRRIMNVNFFGHVAMTKKFLPMLISRRNCRVVNICSATGFFTIPNTSAYSASKCALEAFSDCLRREMAPWGLHVSIIEPGTIRTAMNEGYIEALQNSWIDVSEEVRERWGIEFLQSLILQAKGSLFLKYADGPEIVVRAIRHAVMNKSPHIRYRPDWQSKLFFIIFYLPPTWLVDKLLARFIDFIPAGLQYQHPN